MTLALLVPEIQIGGPRSPPPVTDLPKKPSLNRVKEQSVDLIVILLLGHERYAVLSDIINN